MRRTRKCDNPAPANGGKTCQGPPEEALDCSTQACPGKYLISICCYCLSVLLLFVVVVFVVVVVVAVFVLLFLLCLITLASGMLYF